MPLEEILEKILKEVKRSADRNEMIHNMMLGGAKLPASAKKASSKVEEEDETEVDDELEIDEEEETPKPKAKAKGKPAAKKETAVTEEDVRLAANAMVRACVKSAGGDKDAKKKDAAVKEGKKQVKRVLSEFDVELIEELTEDNYKLAIRAFDRVAGTFAPEAEESGDLDI